MMMIVRLYPKDDKEKLWNCVLPVLQNMKSENFKPLFMSQWEPVEFTTVMFDVSNPEIMYRLFTRELSKCDMIAQSRTLTLMSPIFYPVPKKKPEVLHRYRIAIQVDTAHLESVFGKITDIDYRNLKVYPTYQAFSFGEDDILLSILSENEEALNNFIQDQLGSIEGIIKVEYITITRSHRIVAKDEWQNYRKKLYKIKSEGDLNEMDEDYDWSLENEAGMSGAFIDEL